MNAYCDHCDRQPERDGVVLVKTRCGMAVCGDCAESHRDCPGCARERAYERADWYYDRMREN